MPKPVHHVKLDKRVRAKRDAWDRRTRDLHAEYEAEAARLQDVLERGARMFGKVPRLDEKRLERAKGLYAQIQARKAETARRLRAIKKERMAAKFKIMQRGNLELTIQALERRLAKGDDVADRLAEMRARVPVLQQAAEDAESVIDEAFGIIEQESTQ